MEAFEQRFWHLRQLVRYGLSPASWAVALTGLHLIWTTNIEPPTAWAASSGFLVLLYLIVEWAIPYERRWRMT